MKQVDFYLIGNQVADAKYKLASRLANKLQSMDQTALLVTDTMDDCSALDRVMWSFSDASFLAHELINDSDDSSNFVIAQLDSVSAQVLEKKYDVLVNLSTQAPDFSQQFGRIAEVVEHDEEAKTAARKRYKSYQSEGFELKMHQIEL
ncbi:MAG: DNA polymerase-3 subunit chi [Cryomorphaceae bacterium]|jgi:DNA polymerase-3 subunit chi